MVSVQRLGAGQGALLLRSLQEAGLDPVAAATITQLASADVLATLLAAVPDAVQAAATGLDSD